MAVVADDQVLKQSLQFVWEIWNLRNLRLQHFKVKEHVPKQVAAGGVGQRPAVRELINLANVVQEGAREQQVAIDLRIISANQIAGAKQRNHVVQKPADVGVVQSLGRGCAAILQSDLRILHEGLNQQFQVRVMKRTDESL